MEVLAQAARSFGARGLPPPLEHGLCVLLGDTNSRTQGAAGEAMEAAADLKRAHDGRRASIKRTFAPLLAHDELRSGAAAYGTRLGAFPHEAEIGFEPTYK